MKEKLENLIEKRKQLIEEWIQAKLDYAHEYLSVSESMFKGTVAKIEAQVEANTSARKDKLREEIITTTLEIQMYLALMKGSEEE